MSFIVLKHGFSALSWLVSNWWLDYLFIYFYIFFKLREQSIRIIIDRPPFENFLKMQHLIGFFSDFFFTHRPSFIREEIGTRDFSHVRTLNTEKSYVGTTISKNPTEGTAPLFSLFFPPFREFVKYSYSTNSQNKYCNNVLTTCIVAHHLLSFPTFAFLK